MNGDFDVVVPVARGSNPLDECLQSLRRETGEQPRVITDEFAWQARQRALESSVGGVIAFVDPDVVVCEGWLAGLTLAWDVAPRSVAAIGGPIRGDAPEWARGRLGMIDLGADLLDLDPAERSLFAGNLSFRRRALLGVGGFEPPLDRHDATDWLSEEHEAQRQLGHWGWLVRYAPGVAAERKVQRASTVRRGWRYGVRTGLAGSRDSRTALSQGVKSAVGTFTSVVTARPGAAGERASRAAENLGVLVGSQRAKRPGRTAAHPPDPVTEDPTAAAAGAAGASGPARARVGVDLVLLYHRFAEGEPDPLGLCVAPAHFEQQLAVLGDELDIVALADIAAAIVEGAAGRGRVAITIDDGYVDNLTTGIPLIADAGVPATLFAATGHIETGRRFFWDEMQRLLTGPGQRPKRLELDGRSWPTGTADQREAARQELHRLTQPQDLDAIEAVLDQLRDWAGDAAGAAPDATRPVTVDELRELARTPGLDVGAHTRDHVNLGHRSADEIRAQVERSRDDVADWTGTRPTAFSYPFGIPRHDVSEEARAAVAAAGFRLAVVNQPVPVESRDDVFAIPRVFAPDLGADDFRTWLRRVLG